MPTSSRSLFVHSQPRRRRRSGGFHGGNRSLLLARSLAGLYLERRSGRQVRKQLVVLVDVVAGRHRLLLLLLKLMISAPAEQVDRDIRSVNDELNVLDLRSAHTDTESPSSSSSSSKLRERETEMIHRSPVDPVRRFVFALRQVNGRLPPPPPSTRQFIIIAIQIRVNRWRRQAVLLRARK